MPDIRKIAGIIAVTLFISANTYGSSDSISYHADLSYSTYIRMVLGKNLEYMAERLNSDVARANIEAARIYQDPVLSFSRAGSYEDKSSAGYSLSAEISKTFEIGKERRSRINLATSEGVLANALLDEYLLDLLSESTIDYLTAMKEEYLFRVKQDSYLKMKELSDADSIRLSLGSIMAIDAAQSRIEAGILRNELLQADAARINSFIGLSQRTSSFSPDTIFIPTGRFENFIKNYALGTLLDSAIANRPDLKVAKASVEYYNKFLALTKSERAPDIDLFAGASGSYIDNSIMSPSSHEIYAGISVPIKFSNLNKGSLKAAGYQVEQQKMLLRQVEINIRNEVVQAYNLYRSLCQQVVNYDKGLLLKAGEVLEGKIYSYSRGESSLLEVLNAQRTYNDLQTSYIQTMYECFSALVELRKAVGTGNIDM